ncbi:MAG: hypothetical protein RL641_644 [Candidatus Parcubacteria bacterium]|jgi:type II secretory pathway pseudopilin PulG
MLRNIFKKQKKQKGFSILEIVVAAAAFILFATASIGIITQSLNASLLSADEVRASVILRDTIDKVKTMRDNTFYDINFPVARSGLASANPAVPGAIWQLSGEGTSDLIDGKYTRYVTIEGMARKNSDFSLVPVGTPNSLVTGDTVKVTATVSWATKGRQFSRSIYKYLTDYRQTVQLVPAVCQGWDSLHVVQSITFPSNYDALKVVIKGNYAYVVTNEIDPGDNLYVVGINKSIPAEYAQYNSMRVDGDTTNIFERNGYLYITTKNPQKELQVYSIVDSPGFPVFVSSLDLPGTNSAVDVWVNKNNKLGYVIKGEHSISQGQPNLFQFTAPSNSPATLTINPNLSTEIPNSGDGISNYYQDSPTALDVNKNRVFVSTDNRILQSTAYEFGSVYASKNSFTQRLLFGLGFNGSKSILVDSAGVPYIGSNQGSVQNFDINNGYLASSLVSFVASSQNGDVDVNFINDMAFSNKSPCLFIASNMFQLGVSIVDIGNFQNPFSLTALDVGGRTYGIAVSDSLDVVVVAGSDSAHQVNIIEK